MSSARDHRGRWHEQETLDRAEANGRSGVLCARMNESVRCGAARIRCSEMQIWIESEHVSATPGSTDDNADVVVTLDDASRWAATFITYRNVETLQKKHAETGECLAGRYLWATNLIVIDEISRPAIEAVVADLRSTQEFESAFQKLLPCDAIRLIYDRSELRGTCYFELLPGRYEGECWRHGSVFITEESWGYLEPTVQVVERLYDHYSFIDVPSANWREILTLLRVLAADIERAQKVAQLPSQIGFFFSTSRATFAARFRANRDALVALIRDLCAWIERQLETHEYVAILGI